MQSFELSLRKCKRSLLGTRRKLGVEVCHLELVGWLVIIYL